MGSHAGHLALCAEGSVASSAVLVGGQVMTAELEVVVDAAVRREEALRVAR